MLHALSDPARQRIVQILSEEGRMRAASIHEHFSVPHPAISQHLGILREAVVVNMEKIAQYRFYSINEAAILEVEEWASKIIRMWKKRFKAPEAL